MKHNLESRAIIENYLKEKKIAQIEDFVKSEIAPDSGHADSSKIATAVYCLIWQDTFGVDSPPLGNFYENPKTGKLVPCGNMLISKNGMRYSGETLNSYATLFGDKSRLVKSEDSELKQMAEQFKIKYRTIGNFVPFPVITYTADGEKIPSLNQWKGFSTGGTALRDFADLYLLAVQKFYEAGMNPNWTTVFEKTSEEWRNLAETVFEANKHYFERFNGFYDYCDKNMLKAFLDEAGQPKQLFPHEPGLPLPWIKSTGDKDKLYAESAKEYIINATIIIEARAEEIRQRLEQEGIR